MAETESKIAEWLATPEGREARRTGTHNRLERIKARLEAATVHVFVEPEDTMDGDRFMIVPAPTDTEAGDYVSGEFVGPMLLTRADLAMLGDAAADLGWLLDQIERLRAVIDQQDRVLRAVPARDATASAIVAVAEARVAAGLTVEREGLRQPEEDTA